MRFHTSRIVSLSIWLLAICLVFACQRPEDRRIALTQAQWQQVQKHLLDDTPAVEHELGVQFADQIELIGLDIDGTFAPGEEIELTWYWHALDDVDQDWKIFVHFDSDEHRFRQNLDHYPLEAEMNEAYRTYHWKEGHILEDVQRFTLVDDYPDGDAVFYVGLFRDDTRAPVSNDAQATEDNRAIGPTVEISAAARSDSRDDSRAAAEVAGLSHSIPRLDSSAADALEVDGRLDESFWRHVPALRLGPLDHEARLNSVVHAAYTEDQLLVAARLDDPHIWATIDEAGADLLGEEVFVTVLAPRQEGPFVEIQVNPQGTVTGLVWDEAHHDETAPRNPDRIRRAPDDTATPWNPDGLEAAVYVEGNLNDRSDEDRHWTVELSVPLSELAPEGGPVTERDRWKVNFYRIDRPGDDEKHLYAWSTETRRNLHRLEQYGTIIFGSELEAAPRPRQQLSAEEQQRIREAVQQRLRELPENRQPPTAQP